MLISKRLGSIAVSGVLLATLAACGSQPMAPSSTMASYPSNSYPTTSYPTSSYPNQYPSANNQVYVEYGRVTGVQVIQTQEPGRTSGAGAIIGGIAGAVIGNQIGGGSGRDVARVAGIAGGALAGNAIERNSKTQVVESYRISVQTDQGAQRSYDMAAGTDLRAGDRVKIENGQLYRF